ncbi:hypothetical protein TNCV_4422891 [Trichonephila clavipes]|nr:hypothetical protein TNCV_4422891 [Trichonephila clavipes]
MQKSIYHASACITGSRLIRRSETTPLFRFVVGCIAVAACVHAVVSNEAVIIVTLQVNLWFFRRLPTGNASKFVTYVEFPTSSIRTDNFIKDSNGFAGLVIMVTCLGLVAIICFLSGKPLNQMFIIARPK